MADIVNQKCQDNGDSNLADDGDHHHEDCVSDCYTHVFVLEHGNIVGIPWIIPAFAGGSQFRNLLKTVQDVLYKWIV